MDFPLTIGKTSHNAYQTAKLKRYPTAWWQGLAARASVFAEEKVNSSWSTNPVKEVTQTILQHIFFPTPTPPTLHFSSLTSPPSSSTTPPPAPTASATWRRPWRSGRTPTPRPAGWSAGALAAARRSHWGRPSRGWGAAGGKQRFFWRKMGKYDKFEDICVFWDFVPMNFAGLGWNLFTWNWIFVFEAKASSFAMIWSFLQNVKVSKFLPGSTLLWIRFWLLENGIFLCGQVSETAEDPFWPFSPAPCAKLNNWLTWKSRPHGQGNSNFQRCKGCHKTPPRHSYGSIQFPPVPVGCLIGIPNRRVTPRPFRNHGTAEWEMGYSQCPATFMHHNLRPCRLVKQQIRVS